MKKEAVWHHCQMDFPLVPCSCSAPVGVQIRKLFLPPPLRSALLGSSICSV